MDWIEGGNNILGGTLPSNFSFQSSASSWPEEKMSSFSFSPISPQDIVSMLSVSEIANLTLESLSNPTSDFACSLYISILSYMDPLMDDLGEADFGGLDLLEDLDVHTLTVRMVNLFRKMRKLISSTCSMSFTMKDLTSPKRDRTIRFISGIINFLLYRDDKLIRMRPIVENTNSLEMRLSEVETKRSELNKEIVNLEDFSRMEQPIIDELQSEVNKLHKTIQSLNKQQRSIRNSFQKLQDDAKDIDVKISSADLKLVEVAQLNNSLHSNIVQSPDKLQSALEEKKSIRAEVLNLESLAMQSANEKKSKFEVYCEAARKLSRRAEKMQALQEQLSAVKNVDKEVKILKNRLAEEEMTYMSLEAKTVEREGRDKKASDLENEALKEKNMKSGEASKELKDLKLHSESKVHEFSLREQNVQAKIHKVDSINLEIKAVNESGLLAQQKLCGRSEEIMEELKNYFRIVDPVILRLQNGFSLDRLEMTI